MPTKYNF